MFQYRRWAIVAAFLLVLGAVIALIAILAGRPASPPRSPFAGIDPSGPIDGKLTASGQAKDQAAGPSPSEIFSEPLSLELGRAVVVGDIAGIHGALAKGAPINSKGKHGLTALHLSLLSFQISSFEALLESGADPNLAAANGDSVMSLAPLMPEPSWLASAIADGGDLERRDLQERTPLMLAARHERLENARLLVSRGADLNAADKHGETALFHTFQAFRPNLEIARNLLANGADPNRVNAAGFTARDFAETYGDPTFPTVFPP